MGLLLAFAPFVVFALLDRLVGATPGLIAGAATSAILIGRDVARGVQPKILEIGTLVLFGGLALFSLVVVPAWSVWGVRLAVDLGLLAIVLVSMAIGRPFTLQYAREQVDPALWTSAAFLRTNLVVCAAWAAAFALMVAADLLMVMVPDTHPRVGILITVAALVGAAKFTAWYPDKVARR